MPLYIYKDRFGHISEIEHRMLYTTGIVCACGANMHRVPQAPRVNWSGDNSQHPLHPAIKRLIDTASQRRDQYLQEKEEHERATAAQAQG